MKGKIDIRIPIIIILTIILIIMCYFYFKSDDNSVVNSKEFDTGKMSFSDTTDIDIENSNSENSTTTTIVNTTTEISSGLTEEIELHATYYLEECYVETNQLVKSGENILMYTNGTYLTAPYDCIITELNIPDDGEICTNNHYIEISSNNILMVQFRVDESNIDLLELGQTANITVSAYDDEVLEGIVTKISSTASNGKFTVTVEFENDGNIMIGMTATVTISG